MEPGNCCQVSLSRNEFATEISNKSMAIKCTILFLYVLTMSSGFGYYYYSVHRNKESSPVSYTTSNNTDLEVIHGVAADEMDTSNSSRDILELLIQVRPKADREGRKRRSRKFILNRKYKNGWGPLSAVQIFTISTGGPHSSIHSSRMDDFDEIPI